MEKTDRDKALIFLKERIADIDKGLNDLHQMEEFVNFGYVDIKPLPVGHDASSKNYSGQYIAWVTPSCPTDKHDEANTIVQKLEDRSLKINEYFNTSTPITSEIFINICNSVGIALNNARKTFEEVIVLVQSQ